MRDIPGRDFLAAALGAPEHSRRDARCVCYQFFRVFGANRNKTLAQGLETRHNFFL
jgi:hypothetical protein